VFGIDTIYGLPLHPLVVHVAVVLVPLAALALIAVGWRPEWRRAYLLPIAVLALAGAGAAMLAAQTGEAIQGTVRDAARAVGQRASFGDHPQQGNAAEIAAMLFSLCAVAFWAIDQWGERYNLKAWTPKAAYAVSAVVGLFAVATIVVAGHSGAVLVWKDVGNFVSAK
jgi:uncharacterized membrane protein